MEQTGQHAKPVAKIGVIGAPDVGKSTLIAALARQREEQHPFPAQQFTEAAAAYATKDFFCHYHDLPALEQGNEDHLRYALAQLSGVILVLDVQAGITTATRHLLQLVQAAGIPLVVPFLNKCDNAPWLATLDEIEETVETALADAGFPAVTPIWGAALPALGDPSSTWGETIEQFLLHLDYHLKALDVTQFCNQVSITPIPVTSPGMGIKQLVLA